jgi:hypothetical protein
MVTNGHPIGRRVLRSTTKQSQETHEELDEEPEIAYKRPRLPNSGQDPVQQLMNTVTALCQSILDQDKLECNSHEISSKKSHAARGRAVQANRSAAEAIHKCSRKLERAIVLHETSVRVMEEQYLKETFNRKDWWSNLSSSYNQC